MSLVFRAFLLCCLVMLGGCAASSRVAERGSESAALPSYAEVASVHNARAARLGRLWARAAVQLRYTDGDGKSRREQGEGHLQVIQPDRLALSVGKLGEVLFWLGSDSERFWWFDLNDEPTASVGLHANATEPCVGEIPLPVHPLDLLDLLGITPMPDRSGTEPVVGPGGRLVVDVPARVGARRMFFDRETMRPVRVELWLAGRSTPAVVSELDEYERVEAETPGVDPRVASRVSVRDLSTGSEIVLFFSDMSDGSRPGRLEPIVFDFAGLLDAYRPRRLVVLDEACARSAWGR